MSRKKKQKKEAPPSSAELLADVRDVLLAILLCNCCPVCSGTGRAHVDNKDGLPVFGTCECRNRGLELLKDFGVGPEDEGDEQDGHPAHGQPEEAFEP